MISGVFKNPNLVAAQLMLDVNLNTNFSIFFQSIILELYKARPSAQAPPLLSL